jgi:hypothetical protein
MKSDTNEGRFQRIKIADIQTKDELKQLLEKYPEAQFIYPTIDLNIEELIREGILNSNYSVSNN